jgi:hypothetical protein
MVAHILKCIAPKADRSSTLKPGLDRNSETGAGEYMLCNVQPVDYMGYQLAGFANGEIVSYDGWQVTRLQQQTWKLP